jgi:hypothetical protein
LISALHQVARAGSPSQIAAAIAIIDEGRRKLYGLLANGPEEE